jgi:hypothetical protein
MITITLTCTTMNVTQAVRIEESAKETLLGLDSAQCPFCREKHIWWTHEAGETGVA